MRATGLTLAALLVVASCTGDDDSTDPAPAPAEEDVDDFEDEDFDDEFEDDEGFDDEFEEEFDDEDFDDEFEDEDLDDEFEDDEGFDDEFEDDEFEDEGVEDNVDDADQGAADPGRIDVDDDLYLVEHGVTASGQEVVVTVDDGDESVLVTFVGADPDDGMFVVEATGPDGTPLVIPGAEPFNNGEVSITLPFVPDQQLTPGDHTFVVESGGEIPRVYSAHKTAIADEQVLDVRFWVVTNSADLDPSERPALSDIFRDVGDRILGDFGLGVGELDFLDAPPEIVDEYAVIDLPTSGNDEQHRRLCGEMSTMLEPSRALNFVIVDRADDPEDLEAETEGNAAGIPGALPVEGSITSCVFMIAEGSRPISEIGNVAWHEAGHLLGLYHTTEQTGDTFDILDDTPECDIDEFDTDGDGMVVFEECPDGDNVMFYDGDGLELSDQQAAVLALHPLFRPA